uniref:Uncharacterized protein n=1 Tax=Mycena chlorophos TaxID=658473 RepID=A0ABQ0LB77_MYCCL|nr:predicted protein [Mycena chlorophos]
MMANKFLDDNIYTNATWASVSSIPLAQINTMEREFLSGCNYALRENANAKGRGNAADDTGTDLPYTTAEDDCTCTNTHRLHIRFIRRQDDPHP